MEIPGHRRGVDRARAAEADEDEVAQVVPASGGDAPDGLLHLNVDHVDDALGRLDDIEAERVGDLGADGLTGLVDVEPEVAAQRELPR